MATPARSIVITGFMGTGKTTAARALADRLGWPLLDMDAEIERRAGRSIRAIFAEQGEPAFRQMERALVAELAAGSGMVIATGGGALVDEGSRERLLASACVVCLDAAPEVIEARLAGSSTRPLAGEWRERLAARQPAYSAIPLHIDTSTLSPEAVAGEILRLCLS